MPPSDGAPPFPLRKNDFDLPPSRRGGDTTAREVDEAETSGPRHRSRATRRPAPAESARRPAAPPATAPRRSPPPPPTLSDADREALELLARVEQRVEVAKSLFRMTAGLITHHAARASSVARVVAASAVSQGEAQVVARLGDLQKIARAATAAAIDVTSTRTPARAEDDEDADADTEPTEARRIPVRKTRRAR